MFAALSVGSGWELHQIAFRPLFSNAVCACLCANSRASRATPSPRHTPRLTFPTPSSWRWLFILEGAGCGLVAAILALAFVPSSLSSVSWLSEAEKDIVRNGDGGNRQKDKGAAAAAAGPKNDGLFADDETSMNGERAVG